jgi:hypothetical protein
MIVKVLNVGLSSLLFCIYLFLTKSDTQSYVSRELIVLTIDGKLVNIAEYDVENAKYLFCLR